MKTPAKKVEISDSLSAPSDRWSWSREEKVFVGALVIGLALAGNWGYHWLKQRPRILTGHNGNIYAVAFSPDGNTLVSGGGNDNDEGEIRLWDWPTGRLLKRLDGVVSIKSLAFSPDGKILISTGRVSKWLVAGSDAVEGAPDEDNKKVALIDQVPKGNSMFTDSEVDEWDLSKGSISLLKTTFQTHNHVPLNNISPDGKNRINTNYKTAVSNAGQGRFIRYEIDCESMDVYDMGTGKLLWTRKISNLMSDVGAISKSDNLVSRPIYVSTEVIAINFNRIGIALISAHNGKLLRVLNLKNDEHRIIVASPDGHWMAIGGDTGDIKLWDLRLNQQGHILKGHEKPTTALAFSPDGKMVASIGADFTIRLWDAATGQEKHVYRNQFGYQVAFSPDGKTLAVASFDSESKDFPAQKVKLWDISDFVS